MEKKLYLSLIILFLTCFSYSQEYFGKHKETIELGSYLIENTFYPNISIEGQSVINDRLSLWGKVNYCRNVIYQDWSSKGYFKKPFYSPYEHVALVYDIYSKTTLVQVLCLVLVVV